MTGFSDQLMEIEANPTARARLWSQVQTTTIDYGIMEGAAASAVAVIPADGLGWSDVGSWESLLDILTPDEAGNVVISHEHLGIETTGSLIHSQPDRRRLVATLGVSDLVIIDTDDVLLICPRERSQEVRLVVDQLKKQGNGDDYL
jgi:mannose-1-phosphate guanylyltransferase